MVPKLRFRGAATSTAPELAIEPQVIAPDPDGRARRIEVVVQGLPFAIVLALVAFMVERDGAFAGTVWYPIALGLLALGLTFALSVRRQFAGLSRATVGAIVFLAAFVVWGFVTILWAEVRGDAWDGSNKAVLYLVVFALLAGWRATGKALWPTILVLGAVMAAEGAITVEQIVRSSNPSAFLIGSRLSEPLGYPNATAALFMIGLWLNVGLASRPWLPAPARGLACGLASLLATLNLLTESRGSVFTLPLVVIVYFVFVPGRLRATAVVALVALGFLPVLRPILHVYSDNDQLVPNLRHAIDLAFLWAAITAVAGWMLAAIDDRVSFPPWTVRRAGVVVLAAVALGLVGILGAYKPWDKVGSAWHSFKYAGEPTGAASHFGGLGSHRYDVWRVGLIEFKRHPIQGIGVDNFLVPYLEQRKSQEEPLYPHSLIVRLLSQTGIIGTLLFVGFMTLTVRVILRIPPGRDRELARILGVGGGIWIIHGLVDWLWEMPVLGVLGMALFGAACGLAPRNGALRLGAARSRLVAAGLVVASIVAALSLVFPWFAQRDIQQAAAVWRTDPTLAFSTLQRAHSLNPLSDQADLVAGAIASHLHRYDVMRDRFQAAVNRSPDDWYANLELGIAASLTDHHRLAATSLQRAVHLDPGEPIIRSVVRTFDSGRRINSDAIDREFESEA